MRIILEIGFSKRAEEKGFKEEYSVLITSRNVRARMEEQIEEALVTT